MGAWSSKPFALACAYGHIEVAELLRQYGAEVIYVWEHAQVTPDSIFGGEVLAQYRAHGIEPKGAGHSYCRALFSVARIGEPKAARYLVSVGADLNQTDLNDDNLVHKAAEKGNLAMLEYLRDEGLDLNKPKGRHAETPLYYAVREGEMGAVEFLLKSGANPNPVDFFDGKEDRWRETPFDICANEDIREVLIRYGAKSAEEIPEE